MKREQSKWYVAFFCLGMLVSAAAWCVCSVRQCLVIGPTFINRQFRQIMEDYFAASYVFWREGDPSLLYRVAMDDYVERLINSCNSGACPNKDAAKYVIGPYFQVVEQTSEYAVVNFEKRPTWDVLPPPVSYLGACYLLLKTDEGWKVKDDITQIENLNSISKGCVLPDKYRTN